MDQSININASAEKMLARISEVIDTKLHKLNAIVGAKIVKVNEDGTVNVTIPPDTHVFTKISNQTPFVLQEGDSVELLLKNGQYTNCWVIAKHSVSKQNDIKEIIKEVLKEEGLI